MDTRVTTSVRIGNSQRSDAKTRLSKNKRHSHAIGVCFFDRDVLVTYRYTIGILWVHGYGWRSGEHGEHRRVQARDFFDYVDSMR